VKLAIDKAAAKILDRMQPKRASAIVAELETIAADPFARHGNVKALAGAKDRFRLRHGDWRVLYKLDRTTAVMTVYWIGTRGGAYR